MFRRTKLICTIGPSVGTLEKILALAKAGMNVARLNFSHGTREEHAERIASLKEARERLQQPLAIMLDTKGPEVRIGKIENDAMEVHAGQIITFGEGGIPINPPHIIASLPKGKRVLFDDGYIIGRIVTTTDTNMLVEIQNEGLLKSGKGINLPDCVLDLPLLTEKDREDLLFGMEQGIDMVALSFVCGTDSVIAARQLISDDVMVISKIESKLGVKHFDAILQVSDGIMIARGDLGVEVPLATVPGLQKRMIRRCAEEAKASIVATQMLESMIRNPRPTRAEATDVANAIYESGSAVMLSGETAAGRYPIESVRTMLDIVQEAEEDFDYCAYFAKQTARDSSDIANAVALASLNTAYSTGASAIFVITSTGRTARLISRLRPSMPILAITSSERAYHQLGFEWGVVPVHCPSVQSVDDGYQQLSQWALEHKHVHYGDLVVLTMGVPFGIAGTTNTMVIQSIGDVLVRGRTGGGKRVHGEVLHLLDANIDPQSVQDKILVLTHCDESYLPLLKVARGAVLQSHTEEIASEKYLLLVAKTLELSVVVRAGAACSILKKGMTVTLDPPHGLVYEGVVEEGR